MVARTLTTAQIAALSIPTVDQMLAVAAAIPQVQGADNWSRTETVARPFLELGPGLVRMFRTSKHLSAAREDRRLREKFITDRHAVASEEYPCGMAQKKRPSAGKIVGWSRRSRARMQMQLHRLDYTALFEAGLEPAMVTLTMPGEWEHLAPTPAEFKKIVNRFTTSYRDAWGTRPVGVWKMEFQRRGAPHLHILMTPPAGEASGAFRYEFRLWLSHAWARAVGATGVQAERHLRAGTGIDYVGDSYRDPRRIAAYFGKHGFFAGKDYQNEMPALWRDAVANGEDGARFWGSWGLPKASAVLQLDDVASIESEIIIDSVGVSRNSSNITEHYRRMDDGTWVLVEERQAYATDASVLRAAPRAVDDAGSASPDDVKVSRMMRKLSKSLAMRRQDLVRNKHGQLVLPRDSRAIRRVRFEQAHETTGEMRTRRVYRIGYYHGGSGFLLVPDGRRTGRDIQRLLDARPARGLVA